MIAVTLREKPSPGSGSGPLDAPVADSAPFLLLFSKSPKIYIFCPQNIFFLPSVTNALMGAGGRGICKAHNKPPAASCLTNVMLYFITAAAAAAPARALQIPHPAQTAGTGPRHAAGAAARSATGTDARLLLSERGPTGGTSVRGPVPPAAAGRAARPARSELSLPAMTPSPPICMPTRSYINSSNSLIHYISIC